ncbi:glutathione S-transferase family protein [Acidithiobacillus ferriphilus]|uniref:glutathione S-transferase family protein n=1 Tax=Acidithiobacillus ferriphilus TaxID=1689834 RepID=UPI00232E0B8A|nr:glutathione S-transferase family protein [Acidithiobacillus ferriphilus]WCE94570.1 glutathione S-transferase family protein [Acidithiobacillus ferriphilus]
MPNDNLTFYTNPMSRGRIVRWMLEELGVPYQTILLDYGTSMKAPEYLAINPMGKIPAIQHGQTVVTETAAICAYLADAFPQMGMAPALDDRLRGTYYRYLFFAAGPLEAAVSNKALGFIVPPEREAMIGYGTYEAVLDVLEDAVEQGEYLLGENFTAADVYLGSQLGFGLQFGTIERRPGIEHYWSRISARPAAIQARQIDDDLISNSPQKK